MLLACKAIFWNQYLMTSAADLELIWVPKFKKVRKRKTNSLHMSTVLMCLLLLSLNKNEKYKNFVSDVFLNHFRSLHKSETFSMMHEVLNIFEDPLNGKTFIEWFAIKPEIRDSRLIKNEKTLPCGEKMNFKK